MDIPPDTTDHHAIVARLRQSLVRMDLEPIRPLLAERQIHLVRLVWHPDPDSLPFPIFTQLWQHWNQQRGEADLPHWNSIDIQSLPAEVRAYTLLLEADDDLQDFIYRYYGEGIANIAGRSWLGHRLSALARMGNDGFLFMATYQAAADRRCPLLVVNADALGFRRLTFWHRLLLPLGGDADQIKGFLVLNFPHVENPDNQDLNNLLYAEENRYLHRLLQASPVGAGIFQYDQPFLFANDALANMLRLPKRLDAHYRARDFYRDTSQFNDHMTELHGQGQLHNQETALIGADGSPLWAVLSYDRIRNADSWAVLMWIYEITERKALEEQLRHMAAIDALTGIANRRHFLECANTELARSHRYGHPSVVLMIDVDYFKSINDRFGHAQGDKVLVAIVRTMTDILRDSDILGRLGGEEFAVLMPHTDTPQAMIVAERLRQAIASLALTSDNDTPMPLSISIGISAWRNDETLIDIALNRADRCLYQAKNAGRNRIVADTDHPLI